MRPAVRNTCLGLVVLTIPACISTVSVDRVKPGEPADGLVYSLPKTYLQVVPQADGTMAVKFVFLPDPENTYAIDAASYMASHTLNVELTEAGLLKVFDWQPDSTTVADAAVDAAAKVYEARVKEKEERAEEREREVEEAEGEVETAEAAVKTARRTLEARKDELAALEYQLVQQQAQPQPSQSAMDATRLAVFRARQSIRLAEEDLRDAEAELAAARAKRDALTGSVSSTAAASGSLNEVANQPGANDKGAKAWGGVLYEVREGYSTADLDAFEAGRRITASPTLVAVRTDGMAQVRFETTSVPKKPAAKPTLSLEGDGIVLLPASRPEVVAASDELELATRMLAFLRDQTDRDAEAIKRAERRLLEVTIAHEQALAKAQRERLELSLSATAAVAVGSARLIPEGSDTGTAAKPWKRSPTAFDVTLPGDTASGRYVLEITFAQRDGADAMTSEFAIEVR